MAVSRKGSRQVVVDGVHYRWRVSRRLTYHQAAFDNPLTAVVWRDDTPDRRLYLTATGPRPDNWLGRPGVVLTPGQVAEAVRAAVAAGWSPAAARTFRLSLPASDFGG